MVKSARTKKFDDEIDLIKKQRLRALMIFTGRFNHLYTNHSAKFRRVSSNPGDVFYLTNNENLVGIQEIYTSR